MRVMKDEDARVALQAINLHGQILLSPSKKASQIPRSGQCRLNKMFGIVTSRTTVYTHFQFPRSNQSKNTALRTGERQS